MKTYHIPIVWTLTATMEIEANDLEDALGKAEEAPLPNTEDGEYLEGSFEIDYAAIPQVNELTKEEKRSHYSLT